MNEKARGALIAETAASIAIFLPIVLITSLLLFQCARGFLIRHMVAETADRAARTLAIQYWKDPSIEFNRSAQEFYAFDQIRVEGIVQSSEQFHATFDHTNHVTVTVVVTFQGQRFGLPRFPDPDIFQFGNFSFAESATQWLK